MGEAAGIKLEQKNGQWILSLRSCTNDQAFCNPDKGCWSNTCGGDSYEKCNHKKGDSKAPVSQRTIHSGEDKNKNWSRASLNANSKVRQAVKETEGEVLLDQNGKIVVTDFNDSNQQKWNRLAKEGKDYYEILMSDYGSQNAAKIDASCSSSDSNVDSNIDSADVEKLTNLSQSEAWNLLIGKSSNEYAPYISESEMDKRTTTIKVPVRQWSSQSGHNPGKDTAKKEISKFYNISEADFNKVLETVKAKLVNPSTADLTGKAQELENIILEKVQKTMMDKVKSGSYSKESLYQEEKFANELKTSLYDIKGEEFVEDYLITPDSEYKDLFKADYSDYIERSINFCLSL